jgi:hypothetical protein
VFSLRHPQEKPIYNKFSLEVVSDWIDRIDLRKQPDCEKTTFQVCYFQIGGLAQEVNITKTL